MSKSAEAAKKLLTELKIKELPIPVEEIAEKLGAKLRFEPFDGELSGMLFRNSEHTVIGVNSSHANTRQRFTIAHEIAHLRLHKGELFVDEAKINFRDSNSSLAIKPEEMEANAFAAELLMPDGLLRDQITILAKKHRGSPDELIEKLAKAFDVSHQAMEYRLNNLGLLISF
jgi:Zn-dependent peptidase ImmA (M78 family)